VQLDFPLPKIKRDMKMLNADKQNVFITNEGVRMPTTE